MKKNRINQKIYKKNLIKYALSFIFTVVISFGIVVYTEFTKAKVSANEFSEYLSSQFDTNENIAIAISSRFNELKTKNCSGTFLVTYGKAINTASVNQHFNRSQRCLVQALEFVNKTSQAHIGKRFSLRYFYSPELNVIYFFRPDYNDSFSLQGTLNLIDEATPDYYDRLLSQIPAKSGMYATDIYEDSYSDSGAYTIISFSFQSDHKSLLGYLFYDLNVNSLNKSIKKRIQEPPETWMTFSVSSNDSGLCFFGDCSRGILNYKSGYLNKYDIIASLDLINLFKYNWYNFIVVLALLTAFALSFLYATKSAIQRYVMALRDNLTGAYTRKILNYLDLNANSYLILFDANKFKSINDNFGHLAGDSALIKIVQIIIDNIKAGDTLIRIGGDEFLLIVNGHCQQSVEALALRITQDITANPIKFNNVSIPLAVSYGVERYDGSFNATFERVDSKMYQYKAQTDTKNN